MTVITLLGTTVGRKILDEVAHDRKEPHHAHPHTLVIQSPTAAT
jgi:hypothetical protein